MSVTVVETNNIVQVLESVSSVTVSSDVAHSVGIVGEDSHTVDVIIQQLSAEVIEIGHLVEVVSNITAVVEVQTAGPKGDPASIETGPAFTYTNGVITRIDYDSGAFKALSYTSGRLVQVDFVKGANTKRKTLLYNGAGVLTEIVYTEI